jgi:hypothetical protein
MLAALLLIAQLGGDPLEFIEKYLSLTLRDLMGAPADSTSYIEIRASLAEGRLPSRDAVHIEELLNRFTSDAPPTSGANPVATTVQIAEAPWHPSHRLVWFHFTASAENARELQTRIEFNPAQVSAYRVIGYSRPGFRRPSGSPEASPAGNLKGDQSITSLIEVIPYGEGVDTTGANPDGAPPFTDLSPARRTNREMNAPISREMAMFTVNYRRPGRAETERNEIPITDRGEQFRAASEDFRFAAAVVEFGLILRNPPLKDPARLEEVLRNARSSIGKDADGNRAEFVRLVETAQRVINGAEARPAR